MSDQLVEQADPEEVFAALADERRLGILRALWEADGPLQFSALREAVGVADSGQFNYHLDKLVGRFVTRSDGAYELTQAGKHVNGAIASGIYTARGRIEPIELDSPCRACGGDRSLEYENEVARIECDSCPVGWAVPVPPAVLAGYDREAVPSVVSRYFRTTFGGTVDGFCSYCNGRTEPTVGPIGEMDVGPDGSEGLEDQPDDLPVVQFDCQRCGATAGIGLDYALLIGEPPVARFYHEHGLDVRERPLWDVDLDLGDAELDRRDPVRASVTFRAEDARLTVTVDGSFDVVDVEG